MFSVKKAQRKPRSDMPIDFQTCESRSALVAAGHVKHGDGKWLEEKWGEGANLIRLIQ